ncbi:hypothetical protein TNCV_3160331 [Trichonephila clavipes]|nr:hypothetical protein TNCV_3160331 [Trichonephila clavipes]
MQKEKVLRERCEQVSFPLNQVILGFHLVECSEAPCNVPAFQSSPVFFQGVNEGRHRSNGGVHRSKKETESGQA